MPNHIQEKNTNLFIYCLEKKPVELKARGILFEMGFLSRLLEIQK